MMIQIRPRSEWHALNPLSAPAPWKQPPTDLVVHWVGGVGTLNLSNVSQVPQAIRNIQAYEQRNGYNDIAYNLIVDPFGNVWEGRGLGYAGAANGGTTNGTKPSVCLLLNKDDLLTEPMKIAIREIRRDLCKGQLLGHKEVNITQCPGNNVMQWIQTERVNPTTTPILEDELSWSKWNDLEKIDMVNQVAEEVSRRLSGGTNIVTGKAFTPNLNDYVVLIVTALSGVIESAKSGAAIDLQVISKNVSDEIAKRLAE